MPLPALLCSRYECTYAMRAGLSPAVAAMVASGTAERVVALPGTWPVALSLSCHGIMQSPYAYSNVPVTAPDDVEDSKLSAGGTGGCLGNMLLSAQHSLAWCR